MGKKSQQEIDPYEVLGVDKDCSNDDIKKAYRRKAKDNHPDLCDGDSNQSFKDISHAYELIGTPRSRSNYDRTGTTETVDSSHIALSLVADFITKFFEKDHIAVFDATRKALNMKKEELLKERTVKKHHADKYQNKIDQVKELNKDTDNAEGLALVLSVLTAPLNEVQKQIYTLDDEIQVVNDAFALIEGLISPKHTTPPQQPPHFAFNQQITWKFE